MQDDVERLYEETYTDHLEFRHDDQGITAYIHAEGTYLEHRLTIKQVKNIRNWCNRVLKHARLTDN